MFHAFGNLSPCALIAVTLTALVSFSANIVVFKLLRLRVRLVTPKFLLICPPLIIKSPLFNESEQPNLMKSRNVECIWNWSPFCPPFRAPRPCLHLSKNVIRFLGWKDSKRKTKIHKPSCLNFESYSKQKYSCPSRLAAGASLIYHSILNKTSRPLAEYSQFFSQVYNSGSSSKFLKHKIVK